MAMETTNTSAGASTARQLPKRSLGGLIAISIFWFALNFHWTALLFIIVPSQVKALLFSEATGTLAAQAQWVNSQKDLVLGVVEAPGLIVALIANPLFGLLSDRTRGRFGRRRPYILAGTALNVVGLALMALVPMSLSRHGGNALAPSIIALLVGLMVTQLANNSAAAPFHALLPDFVPEPQLGVASGIMGLAQLLGTIGGFVAPGLFGFDADALIGGKQTAATYSAGMVGAYATIAAVMVVMALLTAVTVREAPWHQQGVPDTEPSTGRVSRDLLVTVVALVILTGLGIGMLGAHIGISLDKYTVSILELIVLLAAAFGAAKAFDFRLRRNLDFTWVLVTRMLVMMGINIVSTFLQYYLHDVGGAPHPEAATGTFGAILTLAATASTLFAGWASDRVGRKRMVYISGSCMALVGAAFIGAPYLVPTHVLTVAYAAGAIYGLGYGAYISVDWALVAAVLPSPATFARDMGIWNIGVTIPQVVAAVFGGWLLTLGVYLGDRTLGYTLLFVSFAAFCVLGTVTVRNIKGVR